MRCGELSPSQRQRCEREDGHEGQHQALGGESYWNGPRRRVMPPPVATSRPCYFEVNEVPGETGFNTGRQRYRVRCVTCDVVIHPATTGPVIRVNQHLRDVAEGETDLEHG